MDPALTGWGVTKEEKLKNYTREAFARDTAVAACHFPFFVAVWFGTTPTEDLIDVNFPFFFLQRYVAFLEDRKEDIFRAIATAEGVSALKELEGENRPLGA